MTLSAEDMQTAGRNYLLPFTCCVRFVNAENLIPILLRCLELLTLVIEAQHALRRDWRKRALGAAEAARHVLLDQFLASEKLRIAAEQNISSTTGHVCRDCDHAEAAGLRNDFRLPLVILRIQHNMTHALALQNRRQQLRLLDRSCAYEHRLALLVQAGNLIGDSEVFLFRCAIDDIRILKTAHFFVRWNDDDVELINLVELRRLCLCGSGHAGELAIKAKV